MGKKERDRVLVWKYHRHSTGVASGRLGRFSAPDDFVPDDIMVGLYHGDGSVEYEFRIQHHRFERTGDTIRVLLFSDAFAAFKEFAIFFDWLAHTKPQTLDAVERWLL